MYNVLRINTFILLKLKDKNYDPLVVQLCIKPYI